MTSLERILHGTTLADKLVEPSLADRTTVPAFPGRPHGLERPPGHRRLPTLRGKDVEQEEGRRRILHELANHELQAIELLAMALARWPDAPEGFRRSLLQTLLDEQRHLQLYAKRLQAEGGDLGMVPVSTSFWDTLYPADLPGFVAGLSLCFEAANLDFATTWRDRFARIGDSATAAVLQTVLDDEIQHVARGLAWFDETLSDPGADRLDAWQAALPHPLTPAHARGSDFNATARRRAGFRSAEIRRLARLGGHRSRAPRVLAFDPAVEDAVAGRTPSRNTLQIREALAVLPLYLAAPSDIVAAPEPDDAFLDGLADAGFALPRFDPDAEVDTPWGPTPETPGWRDAWKDLSDKTATLRRLQTLPPHPAWVEELGEVWETPQQPRWERWILKAAFSASGTRRIQGEGTPTPEQERWLAKNLPVVAMPFYDRVADVSVHLDLTGEPTVAGITRFETHRGRFRGAWPMPWIRTFGVEQRTLHGDGDPSRAFETALLQAGLAAGAWARELGYDGPLSIDALIVATPMGLRLHPWLETNARNTLGRVALALKERVHPRSTAFWHVGTEVPDLLPVELEQGRIRRGVLATTPATAGLRTVLEVR